MGNFLCPHAFNVLTDNELGGVSLSMPTTWNLFLSTAPADGLGTLLPPSGVGSAEVSGGGYARVAIANNATNFGTGGVRNAWKTNAVPFTFPVPTGSWGTILSAGFADPSGNVWRTWDLETPWTIGAGSIAPTFPAGNLWLERSSLCDSAAALFLDWEFGGAGFGLPGTWSVGLSVAPAYRVGSTTPSGEPVNTFGQGAEVRTDLGNGYARAAIANNLTSFPSASGGLKSNGAVITFPTPTGDWGSIHSVFLIDSPTLNHGRIYRFINLPSPLTISNGAAAPTIAIGALTFGHI